MGRLSTLIGLVSIVAAAAVGCDDTKPKVTVTNERSQAILGSPTVAAPAPAAASAATVPASAPKKPRQLCGGHLGKSGPELPSETPARRGASGERDLPEQIQTRGHYTWINFWAAWCAPCKEEIPRLLAWEKKLSDSGLAFKVVFLSLDDDERQLTSFLDKQPPTGLRRTYWLADGIKRTDWLKAVGVKPDSELPVQLLLDPNGHVRCTIGGAIDDSDYDQLRGLLNGTD
jgi:thiol-disulfide isomerase/thioredoxin